MGRVGWSATVLTAASCALAVCSSHQADTLAGATSGPALSSRTPVCTQRP